MVKETVVLFTGKSDGLTWEKFDDSVVSWGKKEIWRRIRNGVVERRAHELERP
jgi:hypothetical protein